MNEFAGKTRLLDNEGLQRSLNVLDARAADLWAVIGVETSGCGFLSDRRVKILYERHVFSRLTGRRFDALQPSLSNPTPGNYGADGAPQYARLAAAMALDRDAALQSCSWGVGQVMGYHAEALGFSGAQEMIELMADSESAQLEAMARYIARNALAGALRTHDWARFARGYNGANYQINHYDTRLSAHYQMMSSGGLPDLAVRSAQACLSFLGHDPHGVDGVMGRMTRAALNDFQARRGMPLTESVDAATLAALRTAAGVG
jgi:hypothetical protein